MPFIVVQVSEIAIPPAWLVVYPTIFSPLQTSFDGFSKSVTLSATDDIVLSEVVLTAKHQEAYLAATTHGTVFENWIFESRLIIRDGEDILIPTSTFSTCEPSSRLLSSVFGYTVSLALPYRQGIAKRESTHLVVTLLDQSSEVSDEADNGVGHENLEINESFLISSVLSSPALLSREVENCE